jgi:hypothetical protein
MGTTNEPEVIDGESLGPIIRKWVVDWLKERPGNFKVEGYHNELFMGPVAYLSEKTGLPVHRVSDISNSKVQQVSLADADALLTAMHMNHLLADGTLEIKLNRKWSQEDWHEYLQERGCV